MTETKGYRNRYKTIRNSLIRAHARIGAWKVIHNDMKDRIDALELEINLLRSCTENIREYLRIPVESEETKEL